MATVPDPTDFGTRRPNEKVITKPGTHFERLQYAPRTPKIEISVSPSDALALFQLFFSDEQLNTIAKNTNKNAKIGELQAPRPAQGGGEDRGGIFARPNRRWVDTTVSELYAYFAIHIYMGVTRETCIKDYWVQKWAGNHARLREAMSLNRFEDISRFLHVSDLSVQGAAHTKV